MPGGPGLSGGCVTIERLGPTLGDLGQPEVLVGVRSHLSGPQVLSPGAEVGGGATSQQLLAPPSQPTSPPAAQRCPSVLPAAPHGCSSGPLAQSPRSSLSVVDDRRSLDVGESC